MNKEQFDFLKEVCNIYLEESEGEIYLHDYHIEEHIDRIINRRKIILNLICDDFINACVTYIRAYQYIEQFYTKYGIMI